MYCNQGNGAVNTLIYEKKYIIFRVFQPRMHKNIKILLTKMLETLRSPPIPNAFGFWELSRWVLSEIDDDHECTRTRIDRQRSRWNLALFSKKRLEKNGKSVYECTIWCKEVRKAGKIWQLTAFCTAPWRRWRCSAGGASLDWSEPEWTPLSVVSPRLHHYSIFFIRFITLITKGYISTWAREMIRLHANSRWL